MKKRDRAWAWSHKLNPDR